MRASISGSPSGKLKLGSQFAFANLAGEVNDFINVANSLEDDGKHDALSLFNRYGCDGNVTRMIMQHINQILDPNGSQAKPESGQAASSPSETLKTGTVKGALQLTLRSCAAPSCSDLDHLNQGQTVWIEYEAGNGWLRVRARDSNGNAESGYVNGRYVTRD
jgi:hypothetical protein